MTPRAPSATQQHSNGASGTSGADLQALALSVAAAEAFADVITRERAAQEAAQFLQRTLGADAVAVALIDGEGPGSLSLAAHIGFGDDAVARGRLADHWARLSESRAMVRSEAGEGSQVTVPVLSGPALLGAITVFSDAGGATAEAVDRALTTTATHAAAAVARADAVRRAAHRDRLDALGEVATGIAHELRNPLFGISSAAQLLRFRVTEDPVVEKNVGRVLREVERLNAMVAALLEYGRPSPLRLEPGDPDTVWDEVLELQRGRLESKALQVARTRAPHAGRFSIDRGQLAQVFTNLLDNAIDAAPEGTDLALTSATLPSGAWRTRLANGGGVLPADVLGRAFDLFFTTKPGGTGVGLPLCQRIVEEHGGIIVLESSAVAGTAAVVTLPARLEGAGGPHA